MALPQADRIRATGDRVMEQQKLRKLFVVAMVVSGVAAAYLMRRRGASLFSIVAKTITNPVGTLASEVGNVVQSNPAPSSSNLPA
jgi:hypothetical protein